LNKNLCIAYKNNSDFLSNASPFWAGVFLFYIERSRLLIIHIVDRKCETLAGVSNCPFSIKKKNSRFVTLRIGPAKHSGRSGMETVAGLCLPPHHTLHRKKARVGVRLASVSPNDNIDQHLC
jgi:hypothetical protein